MSVPQHVHDEIRRLLWALRDDNFSAEDSEKLQQILANDSEARELYVWYSFLCGSLIWDHSAGRDEVALGEAASVEAARNQWIEDTEKSGPWSVVNGQRSEIQSPKSKNSNPLPPVILDTSDFPSPLAPSPFYVAHPFLFSNVFALLVTAIGLLGAWFYQIDIPQTVARKDRPAAISNKSFHPDSLEFVGRVTNMVDVKWSDDQTATVNGANVSVDRQYALASGLMEISYDTGAKVILQGPVTYQVKTRDSGFLARGKLTARVEKKVEGMKPQAANQKSSRSTIHDPLFTIKTPTATVTDLGTEFGLEVHPSGATSAYVFQGIIEMQPNVKNSQAIRLSANESVQVDISDDQQNAMVRHIAFDPAVFVRSEKLLKMAQQSRAEWKPTSFRRWMSFSQELRRDPSLMAYYDFQQQDGRPTVLPNVAGKGNSALDGTVENVTWSDGRMVGKHALQFNSVSDYVQLNLPKKVDDLTLSAWIQVQSLDEGQIGLLMSSGWGQLGQIHWQLTNDGRVALDAYDTSGREWIYKSEPVFDRQRFYQWTHIAVVYDHVAGLVRFYADGKPVGEKKIIMITPLCIREARIGQWNMKGVMQQYGASRSLRGRIDEMAIFGRALSASDIQGLFEAGAASSGRKAATDARDTVQP